MIRLETAYALNISLLLPEIPASAAAGKMITGFTVLVFLFVISTLLSASGKGYSIADPELAEKLRNSSTNKARNMLRLFNSPERIPGTICISSCIINIIITILAFWLGSLIIDTASCTFVCYLIEGLVILLLILFFSYILPRLLKQASCNSIALFMAGPVTALEKILKPIASLPAFSSTELKKRQGTIRSGMSRDEFSDALEQTSDNLNEDEKILEGIVNFGNTSVSTIMCPRIDVTAIDIKSGFNQLVQVIISSGFSRIPVYSETFDNVKGILYAKDILPFMSNPQDYKWQSLLREPYFVPESKRINDLLKEFQIKKFHMAVVIDEYGGTSGIVTLEDILEEIVGEITDESDEDEVPYRKIDEKTYVFEGRILLNDIIKILNLNNDPFADARGESETLAGLILEITGEIPVQDQTINFKNFIFSIESADKRRIKEVRVEIITDNDKTEI